jgi:uncharacterized Zn finger protein
LETAVYEKAREIVDEGRVELLEETQQRIYLKVEGSTDTYSIRLESDHTFSCTCPYATLKGLPKGAVCSHSLAALVYLTEQVD